MSMSLPTEPKKATKDWVNQKFLMLGPGKIGKSAFWAEGKSTLFLEFEPGLNHLEVMSIPIRSMDDLRETYAALYDKGVDLPYSTLVFDTIDRFTSLASEEVVMRGKAKYKTLASSINSIGDIPNGAGWAWQTELVHNTLRKFEALPAAIVVIGHWNNKEIKRPTRVVHRDTISIGGQTGTKLLHWADHTLHIKAVHEGDSLKRIAYARPTETMEAGSRGNVIPAEMEWGEDMASNYKALRELFT